jgi:hypothetical protein
MRLAVVIVLAAGVAAAACTGSSGTSSPAAPTASQTMTGTWVGTTVDSSGSMMGAGLTTAMMNNAQWTIVQSGRTFSGTMKFPGYTGMMGTQMTVTGTMGGYSGTFTMTMPSGSMMMADCTAAASGTFEMDDMMAQMHGTYSGTNSCIGTFDHGQITMHR